ncbi:MAG: 50S ribosomal protein L21 [Myxococcota bacterium]
MRTGGKQIRVAPGDVVAVEKLAGQPGERVELDQVLLVLGETTRIGTPCVEGVRVLATIEGEQRGPKLRIFKHKRRKGYRLRRGHRQSYTRIRIESIEGA